MPSSVISVCWPKSVVEVRDEVLDEPLSNTGDDKGTSASSLNDGRDRGCGLGFGSGRSCRGLAMLSKYPIRRPRSSSRLLIESFDNGFGNGVICKGVSSFTWCSKLAVRSSGVGECSKLVVPSFCVGECFGRKESVGEGRLMAGDESLESGAERVLATNKSTDVKVAR